MDFKFPDNHKLLKIINQSDRHKLATQSYPSRGQTSIQEIYNTSLGKLFLKKVSKQNHKDCCIDETAGTLSEREYWAYCLAKKIGLHVPPLCLLDKNTTIQIWLDYPDGNIYSTSQRAMIFKTKNIFECALFDWVTGQIDRHDANYLYNYVNDEVILIDSAFSFLKESGSLPDYLKMFEVAYTNQLNKKIATPIKNKILRLTKNQIKRLVPLRDIYQTQSLFKRQQLVKQVNSIKDIIKLYRGEK